MVNKVDGVVSVKIPGAGQDLAQGLNVQQWLDRDHQSMQYPADPEALQEALGDVSVGQLDAKMFAHIHGDAWVRETKFEGNRTEVTSAYLQRYLEGSQNEKLHDFAQLLQGLKGEKSVKDVVKLLEDLPLGERYMMKAGWTQGRVGGGGHAMLLEFVRTNVGYNIYVFNTGDGLQYHEMNGIQADPVVLFRDVTAEEFFLKSGDFCERIAALMQLDMGMVDAANANQIYAGIFKDLAHRRAKVDNQVWMKAQRAGICSWRVLLAALRFHLQDEALYKQTVYRLKKETLLQMYQSKRDVLSTDTPEGEEMRELLRLATKKMLRHQAKFFPGKETDGVLPYATLKTDFQVIRAILEAVEAAEETVKQKRLSARAELIFETKQQNVTMVKQGHTLPERGEALVREVVPKPVSFENGVSLKALEKQLERIQTLSDSGKKTQIEWILSALPIDGDIWETIPKNDLLDMMKALKELEAIYVKLLEGLADERNVLLAFLVFSHKLALQLDSMFAEVKIPLSIDFLRKDFEQIYRSAQQYERRSDLIAYIQNVNAQASRYSLYEPGKGEIETSPEYVFYRDLLEQNPEWKKSIPESDHWEFKGKSREYVQTVFLMGELDSPLIPHLGMLKRALFYANQSTFNSSERGQIDYKANGNLFVHGFPVGLIKGNKLEQELLGIYKGADTSEAKQLRDAPQYRAVLAPTLQSQEVLYDYTAHLIRFTDARQREIFDHLFFKNGLVENRWKKGELVYPLKEALRQEVFQEQCREFIQNGIQTFKQHQSQGLVDLEPVLYFIHFAQKLRALSPNPEDTSLFPNERQVIQELLSKGYLNENEKAKVHLANILSGSATAEEILTSWFAFQLVKPKVSPEELREAQIRIDHLLAELDENTVPGILKSIYQKLNLESMPQGEWTHLGFVSENKQVLTVDLRQGLIANEMGVIGVKGARDFLLSSEAEQLFGKHFWPQVRQAGPVLYFNHPKLGEMRAFKENKQYIIQRKIGAQWYERISLDQDRSLPEILKRDYVFWRSLEGDSGEFTLCETFECALLFSEGKICSRENPEQFLCLPFYRGGNDFRGFSKMSEMLVFQDDSGQLQSLLFPHHFSQQQAPLAFYRKGDDFVWNENEKFILAKEQRKGWFGSVEGITCIDRDTGKIIYLLPAEIIVDKTRVAIDQRLKFHRYYAFTIVGGQPKAESPEGNLFLAYLFFQQHDYTRSLAYFQKVSVHDVWSEEMIHFAGEIVGEKDQSPNALSIRLQINQALSEQSTLPGQSHSMPIHSVDSLQRQYTSVSHSVDPAFKLLDLRSSSMTMPGLQIYSFLSFTTYLNPNRSWDNHFRKDTGFIWNKSDFEQALVHWIKVAQGGTPDEKRQLRFRLQLMSQCELSETQMSSCELLRRVLLLGEQAPKFPNVTLQNLNECEREGYHTVYPNKVKLEKWVKEVWKLDVPQERVKGQPFVQNGTMRQSITFPLMQTQEVTVAGAVSLSANRSLIPEVKTFVAQPAARWEEALSAKRKGEHANQATFKMGELKGDEKRYERGLQEELKQFQHDYEQGKALNADKILYTLSDAKVLDKLEQQLSADCEKGEHLLQSCEQQILTLANKKPTHHLREMMLQLGGVEKEVTLADLRGALIHFDRKGFQQLNPLLTVDEIDALAQSVLDYLELQTRLQKNQRCLKHINDYRNPKLVEQKGYTIQCLGEEMAAKRCFDIKEFPLGLLFEAASQKMLRPKQYQMVKQLSQKEEGKYQSQVAQLIMGGGKTAVIAAILGFAAADGEHLSLFLTPKSQFSSVKANLQQSQKELFNQDVVPIELTWNQLDKKTLGWLKTTLADAVRKKQMVILSTELPHLLRLKLLQEVKAGHDVADLKAILTLFAEKTDVIADEIDLQLDVNKEVNIEEGISRSVPESWVMLIGDLFHLVSSDPELIKAIRLQDNEQTLVTEETYRNHIRPRLAKLLADTPIFQKVNQEHRESLIRYFCDQISAQEWQEEKDPFIKSYKGWGSSTIREEKELADQIALTRHLLKDIFPVTLSRSTNRNYGRSADSSGKISPYIAANTPATTQFGYVFEEIFYHYQTAINQGITERQVDSYYLSLKETALQQSHVQKIALNQTEAAQEWKRMTGIELADMSVKGMTRKVHQFLNTQMDKRIFIESETVKRQVKFQTSRLTSNANDLVSMFHTMRGLTGTPWNAAAYPEVLKENTVLDPGTDGQIADLLLRKETPIHVLDTVSIEGLFKLIANDPKLRGILDPAALFKDEKNRRIAESVLQAYQGIEAVAFFDEREKLSLLKKGGTQPVTLNGTQTSAFAAKGVAVEELFVFLDEQHTTGIDIRQKADATNIVTLDHQLIRRTFFQAIMRLRQLFDEQNITYVLPQAEKERMGKINSVADLLALTVKNQGIQLSKDVLRHYKHRIDFLPRDQFFKAFLQGDVEAFATYRHALSVSQEIEPFNLFSSPETTVDPVESLCKQASVQAKIYPALESEYRALHQAVSTDPYLPSEEESSQSVVGMEKQVEAEVSVEKKVEQEVLLQAELQNELRGYTKWSYTDHQEVKWKKSGITNFLTKGVGAVPITSLAKALKKYAYKYPYDQIFSTDIQVTDNFRRASKEEISVFDSRQKPAWQILVQKKGDKYTFTLLSLQEAVTFQKWLKTQQQVGLGENVWLIQPDGTPFVDNPFSALDPKAIAKLLIEVNVFNGNLSYLERHPEATLAFFEEGDYDLKLRFLMLKVFSKLGEETVARRSSLLRILNEKGGKQKIASLVTRVADTETPVTLTLSDKEVENLKHPAFLPHVTPEQVNRVPVPFADKLSKKQVAALSNSVLLKNLKKDQLPAVAPEQVEHLTDEQLKHLRRQDQVDAIPLKRLPVAQVKRLSPKKIPQLRTSSQISQVHPLNVHLLVPKQIKHVTKKEQLEALPLSKIRFVPFRNTGKASFTWRLLHKMVRLTTATWGLTRCTLLIASGLFLFAPFSKTLRRSWNHSASLISGQA